MPGAWPYRTLAKTQVSRNELKRIEFLARNDARNVGHTERSPLLASPSLCPSDNPSMFADALGEKGEFTFIF